jgi:hypothetical protein
MKVALMVLILTFSSLAHAHADHPPRVAQCPTSCTKAEIELAAPMALEFLINTGRVDKSWSGKKISKVEKKEFEKGADWVVAFTDSKNKDVKKQNLYIFITLDGILNGANFTGN